MEEGGEGGVGWMCYELEDEGECSPDDVLYSTVHYSTLQ